MKEQCDILKGYMEWLREHGVSSSNYKNKMKKAPLSRICKLLSAVKEGDEKDEIEYKKVCRVNKVLEGLKSKETGRSEKLVDVVVELVNGGDLLYARTIVDVMCYAFAKVRAVGAIGTADADYPYFSDGRSAWKKFREYLAEELDYGYTSGTVDDDMIVPIKKRISKEILSRIDSFDGLILEFEKEKNGKSDFIRFAVEQSFFFSPEIVNDRMKEVVQLFLKEERLKEDILRGKLPEEELLFARKTTDSSKKVGDYNKDAKTKRVTGCFVDNGLKIPVAIDTDGNREVRRLINDYTGYTIGTGKKSIFRNFIISHLWGQAYDPRYFTNFWNIAIVPAWVNSLLDKEIEDDEEDQLIKKLKDTFMNISKALYKLSGKTEDWERLQIAEPEVSSPGEVVNQPPYRIKVLCRKKEKDVLGAIKTCYYTYKGSKGKIS